MNRFLGWLARDISDRQLLEDGQTLLVAVSGGIDSVVLLDVLHRLSTRRRWKLVVAHFNHQLRGRESDHDEEFVHDLAVRLGWPFRVDREPVARKARAQRISIEMAARSARHEFLAAAARHAGARAIALAHHADDQAELFLLRLLRGSSSEGLGGMKWSGPSPADPTLRLVRPLLGRTRLEIEAFATAWKLAFREDSSNASVDLLRNRIRRELIPLLRKQYQPAVVRVLNRQADLLAGDADYLAHEARRWLEQAPSTRPALAQLPLALQRRTLIEQLLDLGLAPEFTTVEALRAGSCVRLGKKQLLSQSGTGSLTVVPVEASAARRETRPLGRERGGARRGTVLAVIELPPGTGSGIADAGDYRVFWRVRMGRAPDVRRPIAGREWVDADKLAGSIALRTVQSGDRFQPLGMSGAVRLQNLFVNARIPRERRAHQLLATDGAGEIWWVAGLRLGERARVEPGTRRFLEWKWELK